MRKYKQEPYTVPPWIYNAIYSPDMLVGRFHYRIAPLLPIDFTGKKGN